MRRMVAEEGKGSRQRRSSPEGFQEFKKTLDNGIVYHSASQPWQHIKNYPGGFKNCIAWTPS